MINDVLCSVKPRRRRAIIYLRPSYGAGRGDTQKCGAAAGSIYTGGSVRASPGGIDARGATEKRSRGPFGFQRAGDGRREEEWLGTDG